MEHKDITGANIHEPKGIEDSLAGEVYVSTVTNEVDGPWSGVWRKLKIEDLDLTVYEVPAFTAESQPEARSLVSNIVVNTDGVLNTEVSVAGYTKNFQELFLLLDNVNKRLQAIERTVGSMSPAVSGVRDSLVAIGMMKEPEDA